jgi:hypothetical protein
VAHKATPFSLKGVETMKIISINGHWHLFTRKRYKWLRAMIRLRKAEMQGYRYGN